MPDAIIYVCHSGRLLSDDPTSLSSPRTLPLCPTTQLATRAFGIPVVLTHDSPNEFAQLQGVQWDDVPCLHHQEEGAA